MKRLYNWWGSLPILQWLGLHLAVYLGLQMALSGLYSIFADDQRDIVEVISIAIVGFGLMMPFTVLPSLAILLVLRLAKRLPWWVFRIFAVIALCPVIFPIAEGSWWYLMTVQVSFALLVAQPRGDWDEIPPMSPAAESSER